MTMLELPHINVLSKCDLLPSKAGLDAFLDGDAGGHQLIVAERRVEHRALRSVDALNPSRQPAGIARAMAD